MIGGMSNGVAKKEWLLNQEQIEAVMPNFDFDLSFEIVGFTTSATVDGYTHDIRSQSGKITREQKDLISKVNEGGRVYFENVIAKGPDGSERNLNTIVFKLQ